jgi:hypothetical protein
MQRPIVHPRSHFARCLFISSNMVSSSTGGNQAGGVGVPNQMLRRFVIGCPGQLAHLSEDYPQDHGRALKRKFPFLEGTGNWKPPESERMFEAVTSDTTAPLSRALSARDRAGQPFWEVMGCP